MAPTTPAANNGKPRMASTIPMAVRMQILDESELRRARYAADGRAPRYLRRPRAAEAGLAGTRRIRDSDVLPGRVEDPEVRQPPRPDLQRVGDRPHRLTQSGAESRPRSRRNLAT